MRPANHQPTRQRGAGPRRWLLALALLPGLAGPLAARAQAAAAPPDSGRVFALADLAALVFAHHPVARQAALLSADAQAQVQEARGGFDPKLSAGLARKEYAGTNYYNTWASELKVPLAPGGLDLKATYERGTGPFVNPERSTAPAGLAGLGLALPLAQGLLLDERRNALRQARALVAAAEADQVKQINELWLQAAKDYWAWYAAHQQAALLQTGVALAQARCRAMARRVALGDAAPVDSVEAFIIVQDRQGQAEQLRGELLNARLMLSNHLWATDAQPLLLPANARPQAAGPAADSLGRAELDRLRELAARQHPALLKLSAKAGQLRSEAQYRRALLLPNLSASATWLAAADGYRTELAPGYGFGWDKYKLGVDVSVPLFLRKERGKLQQVRLKQQDLALEVQQRRRSIQTQLGTAFNTLKAYERQLVLQAQAIANQTVLWRAEVQKFDLGESTMFLVNNRETKLIDLRLKQESMRASYEKARAELYYYAGGRLAAGL